ncbi:general transcription factor 3C polypeptide 6-like isoform X3 [Pararge aegeria]|uniref:general transcription factor 3C polypeptide 6-like isoform X3 n=1 Tax=Pararge aegeria TaxID=116150 RepID=UPI0019D02422|nr:general transcription factor 3C polypeptide 6-like isoform X3 [Pararge aegeria]XP_039765370.1 general transcription factor 3C polypeptide 6-like isoform X3 [Pararge aegeria]XP_039765371.1 general transcription factor 3C polypeptide 6-like isoform X3 [Pararge aegeria]XP_039765372.1 general transcription factor 3C polypeptide 6-like isoform X3 [Pararge aegeria]XP_039765373.1 general transcription factor 3C polypeptide 6-like isoform X3 [Pararge aegeria]
MSNIESLSDEEEEVLVYAEFEDTVNFDKYNSIHVLGLDTKNPIFQLDDTFFTGTYENPLGTFMFFEEDPSPNTIDPLFDKLSKKNLKYISKTRKFINIQHAYVKPKEDKQEQEHQQEEQSSESDNIKPADFKSVQDALEKFKKSWEENASKE